MTEAAEEEYGGTVEGKWRILDARDDALDALEGEMRTWLARGELQETLQAAVSKAKEAQTRTFAVQLATTVGLTLAGNLAAAATRGTVEGAWVARASRAGVGEGEMLAVAGNARAVGYLAGVSADLAVNAGGQAAMGDEASILTLLTVNAVNAAVIGKLHQRFTKIEEIHATLAQWQRIALRDMLTIPIEMVAGGALDYGTRMLLEHQQVAAASEDDAARWFWQGAAIALGRHINTRSQRMAATVQTLERAAKHAVENITARSLALVAESDAVQTSGDVPGAQRLLQGYRDTLADAASLIEPQSAARPPGRDSAAAGQRAPWVVLQGADDIASYARAVPPKPGTLDVFVHGAVDDFIVLGPDGGQVTVDHRSLATYIEKQGIKFERVRLISCKTGAHPRGAAQHLANKLGVEVEAPTDLVHIRPDGSLVVGPFEHVPTGNWETFTPQQSKRRYTPADEPRPPTLRERAGRRRHDTANGATEEVSTPARRAEDATTGSKPLGLHDGDTRVPGNEPTEMDAARQVASDELTRLEVEHVQKGSDPAIEHDTYFVTPSAAARIAELVRIIDPDLPVRLNSRELLIGGGADAWYFVLDERAGKLGGQRANAVTAAEGGFGLPASNVATGEVWAMRGIRTIKKAGDDRPRKPTEWTPEEVAEVSRVTERMPLLHSGHVGVSLDGGATAHGWQPALPDGVLPHEIGKIWQRLKNHEAFPGTMRDDTQAFATGEMGAEHAGWNTRVARVPELLEKGQHRDMSERLKGLEDSPPHEHGLAYSLPLEQPDAAGNHFAASNGFTAEFIRNCAAFLEKLGLKIPEPSGNMKAFMEALEAWDAPDAPIIDARPKRGAP